MYGALWRLIPGPWPVKLLVMLLLAAAVLLALATWVFPWIDSFLPEQDVTVGDGAAGAAAVGAALGWSA